MSIVILTVPEERRRIFANKLHKVTEGKVELVIIQKNSKRTNSFFGQIKNFYTRGGFVGLLKEFWYALVLRFSSRMRKALNYFRERTLPENSEKGFLAKNLEVHSHNNKETLEILKKISPNLLVIWSNTVVKPEIINTAKQSINLHMGLCPYYRGSVANQYAMLLEPDKIGATIHHVDTGIDTGDIIETIRADLSKSPREMLCELNERAEALYLNIAEKLSRGERLSRQKQDKSLGKNFMLKDWTPSIRFKLAKILIEKEKGRS